MRAKGTDVALCALLTFVALLVCGFLGLSVVTILNSAGGEAGVLLAAGGVSVRTLFDKTAQVVDLTSVQLDKEVDPRASRCPWLLTFYSDGCGHCRSAAPKLSNVARAFARIGNVTATDAERAHDGLSDSAVLDVVSMREALGRDVVMQGVVNCAQFGAVCSKEDVRGVPTSVLYLPRHTPTTANVSAATDEAQSIRWGARQEILLGSAEVTVTAVGRAWSDYRRQALAGWTVEDTHFCRELYRSLSARKQSRIDAVAAAKHTTTPSNRANSGAGFQEFHAFAASDVANAFFYTMYHEVALKGIPDPASYTALINFLWRVHNQLPGLPASGLLLFLSKEVQFDSHGNATAAFNASSWQEAVLEAEIPIRGTPTELRWHTCLGSSWEYRGFPCGMWLLYHALTVAESRLAAATAPELPVSLSAPPSPASSAPALRRDVVLKEILDYARHFFTCEPCRQHFMRFVPTPSEDPVLQLWRVHNKVNYFLQRPGVGRGESGASDPQVPKRQFPTVLACRACYRAPELLPAEVTDQLLEDTAFDLPQVLAFLRTHYAWHPEALWSNEKSGPGSPHRGLPGGIVSRRPAKSEPLGLHALASMIVVVAFVGCGVVYSLSHRHARGRTPRRHSKPLV